MIVLCNENSLRALSETPNLTTFLHRKAGMCQHTVLNDEIDDSHKGKSPITKSAVCCLQGIFYVDVCKDKRNLDFYGPSVQ